MTPLEATNIAEGLVEARDDKEYLSAWQHLIDTGLVWGLQGWFGRMATKLIEEGHCTPPENK